MNEKKKNQVETETEELEQEAVPLQTEEDLAEEKRKQAQEQVLALNDKLLRTLAEYDNFRKRSVKEKEAIYPDAIADTVGKFLPVLDSMERAAGFACSDEEYKKGIDMIIHSFYEVFTSLGVEEIPAQKGDSFDPALHNAVMHIEDAAMGTSEIGQVFQKGFRLGERVIRHSMVQVAN